MSSSIGFNNSDFWLAAISITLIVALFLVILERRRFPKQQFIGRLIFSILALVCLLLIYLKPYYSGYRQNQPTLIFTNGHQYKDSLLAEYPSAKSVYWNDSVKSDQLSSNLIIDGYGVPAYDQRKIGDRQVVFVAPKIPDGIIALNYAQRSKVSEPVIFNFEVNGLARHWLKLKTQSKTADSMRVEGDQRQMIKLTYMPASPGRFVNRIEVVNNEGTLIVSEPLPLEVFPVEKLNILLLNKQPTFEVRFLKNYLIEKGHAVYSRSELTKGRYAFESVGFDFERLDFLTERKLEQFHLVISTPEAVRALSGNERTHLERYIREQGLSLILRMDEPSESTKPNWYSFKGKQQDTERDFLDLKIGTQKITLESPRFYFDINGLIEPVFEGKRQPVAVVKPYGVGSVIGVAVDGTFKLALKGQKRLYDLFWTKIISAMSKETSDKLRIATHFPLENVPVDVN